MLQELVHQNASGVLEIVGNPQGAIYLDKGCVTFARTSWAPELRDRLNGLELPEGPTVALDDAPDSLLADLLLDQGVLTKAGLKALLRSAVIDAFVVLTGQLADESAVSGAHFMTESAPHWTAEFLRLPVDSVSAAAGKRAASLTRFKLRTTDFPQLCDLPSPLAVLKAEHWAIACRIDGGSSVRALARQCGIPLCDAIERVGYLARHGLCVTRPAVPQEPPAVPQEPVAQVPVALASPTQLDLPAPRRRADVIFLEDLRQDPPSAEQLKRVLDGLRRLD